jgi:hypothetical protein
MLAYVADEVPFTSALFLVIGAFFDAPEARPFVVRSLISPSSSSFSVWAS